jgi:hypothetical protein
MDPERLARIVAALAVGETDPERSLCAASADVVGVSGAGVVLILRGRTLGTVCVSDTVTGTVEEAQFTLGEGPCVDAFNSRRPVLIPDLTDTAMRRWPAFRDGALASGMLAVFGFPIFVGSVCIGALDLYNDKRGDLSDDQYDDAVVVAHVAGRAVMSWQSVAGPGSLAWQLEHIDSNRAVLHQASGMVSIQSAVSVDDAVLLLRAYAFATDRPTTEVAADVVARSLRLD